MKNVLTILEERGFIKQCTDREALEKRLAQGPTRLYAGFDPTGPSLHAGHMIPLFAMAHLQKAGHQIIALVGGGTARIGDPSGKTEMRKMLSYEQIDQNAQSIKKQIERFVNIDNQDNLLLNNADWLSGLNYIDFLRDIGRHFSVNRMLSFETYKARMESGLSFIEFNYQLLQSYDFLVLKQKYNCDLQIGGDDQWGNIVAGIDLTRRVESKEVYGLTFPLVARADGKKMGKTEKGALFLDPELTSVYDFFQYWRNVPDADVEKFLLLYTFLPVDEIKSMAITGDAKINLAKERLAFELTKIVHGEEEAQKALDAAKSLFTAASGKDKSAIPSLEIDKSRLEQGINIVELFAETELCSSKGEARRLVNQNGASINDEKINDIGAAITTAHIKDGEIMLKAGKKRFFRIIVR